MTNTPLTDATPVTPTTSVTDATSVAPPCITRGEQVFTLRQLSCREVIQSFSLCDTLRESLSTQGVDPTTANALAQHAVLAYLALYQSEYEGDTPRRAFASVEDLLETFTLDDLLTLYRHYHDQFAPAE